MTEPSIRVYVRHVQACGFCLRRGAKPWFEEHNLNWASFVREGIPIEELEAIDDMMCRAVVAAALQEAGK